jgi:hypothetical protein
MDIRQVAGNSGADGNEVPVMSEQLAVQRSSKI